jgi:putative SOS response-associated peptidase YedK
MCNRVRPASRKVLKDVFGDVVESVTVGMDEMVFGYDRPTLPTLVQYPQPQFLDMEWGYLPAAADGKPEMQNKLGILLNARAEGLFERFAFKNSIRERRCILMLDGFYEWQHRIVGKKKTKQLYYVSLKDGLFPAAAIWDICDGKRTFAIITTDANPLMAEIHNSALRQPHPIEQKDWERWLNSKSEEEIRGMFDVYPDDNMQAVEYDIPTAPKPTKKEQPGRSEQLGLFG